VGDDPLRDAIEQAFVVERIGWAFERVWWQRVDLQCECPVSSAGTGSRDRGAAWGSP
jgi:hypothetical protein